MHSTLPNGEAPKLGGRRVERGRRLGEQLGREVGEIVLGVERRARAGARRQRGPADRVGVGPRHPQAHARQRRRVARHVGERGHADELERDGYAKYQGAEAETTTSSSALDDLFRL
mgnify:CR=1 FL=1